MMKGYPPMKLKVFVDDVIAFMEGRNQELEIIAEKVLRAMRREEKNWPLLHAAVRKRSFVNAAAEKEQAFRTVWKHEEWTSEPERSSLEQKRRRV